MSNQLPPPPPPAGWYPDQQAPGRVRFWDGVRWTDQTRPVRGVPGAHAGPPHHVGGPRPPAPGPVVPPYKPAAPIRVTVGQHAPAQENWILRNKVLSGVLGGVVLLTALGAVGAVAGGVEDSTTASSSASAEEEVDSGGTGDTDVEAVEEEPEPVDTDGDGVADADDYAPRNGNVATADDKDTDDDGVPDYLDDFPNDPEFSKDSDGDGVADRVDDFPRDARYSKDDDGDGVANAADAFPADGSRSEITLAMSNALDSAESYLEFQSFSYQGLIDQLSSEYGDGYDVADATWAVDRVDADWMEQAVQEAESYLEFQSFSRQGLIDQLSSPYGSQFTVEQATYAVDQVGL